MQSNVRCGATHGDGDCSQESVLVATRFVSGGFVALEI